MKLHKIFAAICSIAMLTSISATTVEAKKKDQKAKYIFLFIGDGMGYTQVAAAESYLSYKDGKLGGAMLTMSQFPYFGTATTHSADNRVTDSSAAGTAIACGEKTNNSAIGIDPEGKPVRSMAYDLKEDGYQIGIISTVAVNHATPGSFYASSNSRNDYYDISKQIAKTNFDFFAGLGFLDYKGKGGEEEPIDAYLEKNGYEVSYGVAEFKKDAEGHDKAIFCQESTRSQSAGNYDNSGDVAEDATLGEMLEIGLDFIDDSKPFFFMCEGGDIDWAGHSNKAMPMVMNVLDLDNAVAVAYEFYKKHPKETLIIVTADHETGGFTLGAGPDINWGVLEEQWEKDGHQDKVGWQENRELNRKASMGWTTGSHTGVPVPVFSIGKGAEKFSGRMDNTDIKGKILCE